MTKLNFSYYYENLFPHLNYRELFCEEYNKISKDSYVIMKDQTEKDNLMQPGKTHLKIFYEEKEVSLNQLKHRVYTIHKLLIEKIVNYFESAQIKEEQI